MECTHPSPFFARLDRTRRLGLQQLGFIMVVGLLGYVPRKATGMFHSCLERYIPQPPPLVLSVPRGPPRQS